MAGVDGSAMYSSDETKTNTFSFSQGSSYSGGSSSFFTYSHHESYYPCVSHQTYVTNNNLMTMDYCENNSSQVLLLTNDVMEGDDFLNQDVSNDNAQSDEKQPEDILQGWNFKIGREHENPIPEPLKEDEASSPLEISKKRPLIHEELQRCNRRMKQKKSVEVDDNMNTNTVLHKQSSGGCYSEDDCNTVHELNGVNSSSFPKGSRAVRSRAVSLNGITRASRGSATDPQSLYARKRRERINERLRILQKLIPNGTKVDISTMLEEAVQYVKFLQLQIKLLSSDDLWMYAPIAYNGMDIGLDLNEHGI